MAYAMAHMDVPNVLECLRGKSSTCIPPLLFMLWEASRRDRIASLAYREIVRFFLYYMLESIGLIIMTNTLCLLIDGYFGIPSLDIASILTIYHEDAIGDL